MTRHENYYHSFIVKEGTIEYRVTVIDAFTLEYEQLAERCKICNRIMKSFRGIDVCCNKKCKLFHTI